MSNAEHQGRQLERFDRLSYGLQVVLCLLLWCFGVSAVPIYAKRIFDGSFGVKKFPYPCFAAFLQLAFASVLLGCLHLMQHLWISRGKALQSQSWLFGPYFGFKLKHVAPAGVAFGCRYVTANLGLSLADNSTHVLLGATELVWVLLLAVLINKERPGVLEVLACIVSLVGNVIVATSAVNLHQMDTPFWGLFFNLLAPFVGALCISTLRTGVAGLFDPTNCLSGTTSKIEFTSLKLGCASLTSLLAAMLLENGLWSFHGTAISWWRALASYPHLGVIFILASGILTSVLHVSMAWLAWLTSALAMGLLVEIKVLPQWILNYFFGLHHPLSSSYLLGASLGIFGALLYACASWVTQRYGKVSLTFTGFKLQAAAPNSLLTDDSSSEEQSSAEMSTVTASTSQRR